jgi:prepilin-type N-terminal cleavage/methylation domain-containing protein
MNTMNQRAFTLVEIIVVLLLSSILAATTGLILTTFVRSYIVVKQSADVSQKAQMAMKRLKLEFENISDVHSASATSLYYRIKTDSTTETTRVAGLDGTTVKLGNGLPVSSGNNLLDGVSSFGLSFFEIGRAHV